MPRLQPARLSRAPLVTLEAAARRRHASCTPGCRRLHASSLQPARSSLHACCSLHAWHWGVCCWSGGPHTRMRSYAVCARARVSVCVYTRIRACTHTHIHACTHTRIRACTHTHMHACTHTRIHACTHTHIHACTHTHIHACTHTHIYACTHTHAYVYACACTGCTRACAHPCARGAGPAPLGLRGETGAEARPTEMAMPRPGPVKQTSARV
jgi:hypothetical protein